MSQDTAVRKLAEATEALERLQDFKIAALARKRALGPSASFEPVVEQARRLVRLFRRLPVSALGELPDDELAAVREEAEGVLASFDEILSFDPKRPDAGTARAALIARVEGAYQPAFKRLHPLIAYAAQAAAPDGGDGAKKDVWDKAEKLSTVLASIVLATITFWVSQVVDSRRAVRDAAQKDQEIRTAQLSTVQGFMPYLISDGREQDVAVLAISMLGNDSLAVRLGAVIRRDSALQSLLPHLARMDQADLVSDILAIGAEPDAPDQAGNTPLMIAASTGARRTAEALLRGGAAVNAPSSRTGWTPLMFAAARGHAGVAEMLMDAGAQVGASNALGQSPLWLAAQNGQAAAAATLLSHGATVDQADRDNWTPLFIAASNGHVGVATVLLDAGAAVDYPGEDRQTALMAAAEGGRVDVVRLLLARGADRTVVDGQGESALAKAARLGHAGVVELLSR